MKKEKYFIILWFILMGVEFRLLFTNRETSREFFIVLNCLVVVTIIIVIMACLEGKEKKKKDHEAYLANTPNAIATNQIRQSISGLTICDNQKKKELISFYHKNILKTLIPLIILNILCILPFALTNDEDIMGKIITLTGISVIFLFIIFQDIKKISIARSEELYYCPVIICDKKERGGGNRGSYYVKVKDYNNFILDYWFEVDWKFYRKETTATLYYAEHGEKIFVDIKKEEK